MSARKCGGDMPTWLSIVIMLFIASFTSAYMTDRRCNRECESEWQLITYSGSSIEPKNIYICKRCNYKTDLNRHYCSNCGSLMTNGISYYSYSDKIDLSEESEDEE